MAASVRPAPYTEEIDGSRGDQAPRGSSTGISAALNMYCTVGIVPPPPWLNGGVYDARTKINWARECRSFAAEEGADETVERICSSVSEPNSDLAATPPAPSATTKIKKPLPPQRTRGKTIWDKKAGRWTWISTALRDRATIDDRSARSTTDAIDDLRHEVSARLSSLTALALSFEVKRRQDRISDLIITRAWPPISWSEARTVEEAPPPRL